MLKKDIEEIEATDDKEVKTFFMQNKNVTLLLLDNGEITNAIINESDPLFIFLKELFKYPYILLTSRYCSITLGERVEEFDRSFSDLTFTDQNIHTFIDTFLSKKQAMPFTAYLKGKPNLWSLAHVPLNLELITTMWENDISNDSIKERKNNGAA